MRFKLIRYHPQKIETQILANQLVSIFPIEIQTHPTFGIIERVWKTKDVEYSVNFFPEDHIENLSSSKTFLKVKDQIMLDMLQNLEEFEIVLYYSDKEDVYKVEKV